MVLKFRKICDFHHVVFWNSLLGSSCHYYLRNLPALGAKGRNCHPPSLGCKGSPGWIVEHSCQQVSSLTWSGPGPRSPALVEMRSCKLRERSHDLWGGGRRAPREFGMRMEELKLWKW